MEHTTQLLDPACLLDLAIDKLGLKNDAALSRVLRVQPPVISKVRNKKLPVGASLLLRIHELTGIGTRELRAAMGDTAEHFNVVDTRD